MIGKIIGTYEILRELPRDKYRVRLYLCRCITCKREKPLRLCDIKKAKKCKNCVGRDYEGKLSGYFWSHIKRKSIIRNIPFLIEKKFAWNKYVEQNGKCSLTGWDIDFADTEQEHRHGGTSASLDRINNNRGYEPDNIQWLHKDINRLKGTFSQEYILEIARAIIKHRGAA